MMIEGVFKGKRKKDYVGRFYEANDIELAKFMFFTVAFQCV